MPPQQGEDPARTPVSGPYDWWLIGLIRLIALRAHDLLTGRNPSLRLARPALGAPSDRQSAEGCPSRPGALDRPAAAGTPRVPGPAAGVMALTLDYNFSTYQ